MMERKNARKILSIGKDGQLTAHQGKSLYWNEHTIHEAISLKMTSFMPIYRKTGCEDEKCETE